MCLVERVTHSLSGSEHCGQEVGRRQLSRKKDIREAITSAILPFFLLPLVNQWAVGSLMDRI